MLRDKTYITNSATSGMMNFDFDLRMRLMGGGQRIVDQVDN